jgi:hypothetical protein
MSEIASKLQTVETLPPIAELVVTTTALLDDAEFYAGCDRLGLDGDELRNAVGEVLFGRHYAPSEEVADRWLMQLNWLVTGMVASLRGRAVQGPVALDVLCRSVAETAAVVQEHGFEPGCATLGLSPDEVFKLRCLVASEMDRSGTSARPWRACVADDPAAISEGVVPLGIGILAGSRARMVSA